MKTIEKRTHTDRPVGLLLQSISSALQTGTGLCLDQEEGQPVTLAPHEVRQLLVSAKREAEALAWTTAFPALFLPMLLEEKVDEALGRAAKQRRVLQRTSRLWQESTGTPDYPHPAREPVADGELQFDS